MTHREALSSIVKICRESSQMSRRTQACLDIALRALGYTESQRTEIFVKALQRSEEYKDNLKVMKAKMAKRKFVEDTEKDTGEIRLEIKRRAAEDYV